MVRKISGKSKSASYHHLNTNFNGETTSTTKQDIADTLGFTFSRNSSNRNCSEAFKNLKTHQEKVKLNFK